MGSHPKLSICIATYNRSRFIGETLESILPQLFANVELIIVDGASSDNSQEVILGFTNRMKNIRYFREQVNSGVDQDYDKAVSYAKGEYCWLMTDDDILHFDAVSRVLAVLNNSLELVVVNAEVKNSDLSRTITARQMDCTLDRRYEQSSSEIFFSECAGYLTFIGGVVIRRNVWMKRDRRGYYGTLFVHVGVIFQEPPIASVHIISDPLVTIRYGNAMWTGRAFEIWAFKWPNLIWSFNAFTSDSKRSVSKPMPWKSIKTLIYYRAIGAYSMVEYKRLIAQKDSILDKVLPKLIAYIPASVFLFIGVIFFTFYRTKMGTLKFDLMRSQYANEAHRFLARIMWKKSDFFKNS